MKIRFLVAWQYADGENEREMINLEPMTFFEAFEDIEKAMTYASDKQDDGCQAELFGCLSLGTFK
jgi:hypothetical protein